MTFFVSDYLTEWQNDTDAVRACLAAAEASDERTIVFDKKDWLLTEAVLLDNHTHVLIDNCTVKLADFTYDNVFRGKNVIVNEQDPYGMPVDCRPIRDIKIQGRGAAVISGPERRKRGYHPVLRQEQEMVGDFWGWRTLLISLSNGRDFEVSDLTFQKTCCWAMSFDLCRDGYIHDITFDTEVKNGDGIDFRSGCHDCSVERIYGTTSDDTVACTALYREGEVYPKGNYLYPLEPSLCIQERNPLARDISNIQIRDIQTNGRHHGVICLAANGNRVHDIHIENIVEAAYEDQYREATVKVYTGYGTEYRRGDISDIYVKNVLGRYAQHAFYCNAGVENMYLENVTHVVPGREIKLDDPEGVIIRGLSSKN